MSSPVGLHHKVNDLTARGLHEEALELLRGPLEKDPHNPELLTMAGRCALELGHGDYALQCLDYAFQQRPQDLELGQLLGSAYRRCRKFDLAIEIFERLTAQHPDEPQLVGQRGLTYMARGDRKLAEADLRRCLVRMYENARDLGPENVKLAAEARAALLKIGVEFPIPDAEIMKLMRMRDLGDLRELELRCTANLRGAQTQTWLLFLRGCARQGLGLNHEAIADLNQVLEMEPNLIEAYRYRGDAWAKVDRLRAAADYHAYLELGDPRSPDVLGSLGLMYFHARKIEDAISPLEHCLDLTGGLDDGTHWEALARCYLGVARPKDALRAFTQALSKGNGTSAEARYLRGTVFELLGNDEEAAADYRAYLAAHPQGVAANRAFDRLLKLGKVNPSRQGFLGKLFGKK